MCLPSRRLVVFAFPNSRTPEFQVFPAPQFQNSRTADVFRIPEIQMFSVPQFQNSRIWFSGLPELMQKVCNSATPDFLYDSGEETKCLTCWKSQPVPYRLVCKPFRSEQILCLAAIIRNYITKFTHFDIFKPYDKDIDKLQNLTLCMIEVEIGNIFFKKQVYAMARF